MLNLFKKITIFNEFEIPTFKIQIWCCSAATSPEESSFTTALILNEKQKRYFKKNICWFLKELQIHC